MITEAQKHLIFDINCFYQLDSQKDKFLNGKSIAFFPELSLVAVLEKQNHGSVDWNIKYSELKKKLDLHGFSNDWIRSLQNSHFVYTSTGKSSDEFRILFLTAMDMLMDMLTVILTSVDQTLPKAMICESIIEDIFEKNYWDGETMQQIQTVRSLDSILNLDKLWVLEFSVIFANLL